MLPKQKIIIITNIIITIIIIIITQTHIVGLLKQQIESVVLGDWCVRLRKQCIFSLD